MLLATREVAALIADRAFSRLWLVGLTSGIVRWLEVLAVGIFTFDVTGSPFLVALMTFLRMLPMALLGAVLGALFERLSLKTVLLVGLAAMTAVMAVLFALAASGRIEIWHLALSALLGGVFWATDQPARRNMMGVIAGTERVPQALSLDAASNNVTRALGPMLGGLLLAAIGLTGALGIGLVLYAVAFALMLTVPAQPPAETSGRLNLWRDVGEGIALVRRDRALLGALAITVVFNVWAFPYISMIPVIGRDDLGLGSFAIGLLMSAEGSGAFLGAVVVALVARPLRYRQIYYFGTLANLALIAAFALSGEAWLSGLAVLVAGAGAGCFSSMQSTIIFLSAPPRARSRLMGLLIVCIGTGPIGFLHLGWMADLLGASMATAVMAVEGLLALLLVAIAWPVLRPLVATPSAAPAGPGS